MKNKTIVISVAVILAVVVGVVLLRNSKQTTPAKSTTSQSAAKSPEVTTPNTVILKDLDFKTKKLTIKKGETVTWVNQDTAKHDITFDDEAMKSASSELFGNGESFKHQFDTVGTFSYHCTPHPFMKAVIEVVE